MNETVRIALTALKTNKLRSALTMLGVAIGVFSVIGVMTALSVIAISIESGLSFLGSNLFQFAKYPAINTGGDLLQGLRRRQAGELRPGKDPGADASGDEREFPHRQLLHPRLRAEHLGR